MVTRPPRHFPPPWSVAEYNDACFIVRDDNGQALAYVYCENEPGRRAAANLLTRDEARRIASNITKLPELLRAEQPDANALASSAVAGTTLSGNALDGLEAHDMEPSPPTSPRETVPGLGGASFSERAERPKIK